MIGGSMEEWLLRLAISIQITAVTETGRANG